MKGNSEENYRIETPDEVIQRVIELYRDEYGVGVEELIKDQESVRTRTEPFIFGLTAKLEEDQKKVRRLWPTPSTTPGTNNPLPAAA